uniref:CCHC-type domain-containing protein n=1 Tax=Oreochromis niloticus TaxID=8128 RepID=A0A669BC36_ORENI
MTLPRFDPLSTQSSEGSKQDARHKVRLARLQLEKEQLKREFQLKREIELRRLDAELARAREVELKKVEAETKVKLRQLELQQASSPPVAASLSQTEVQFDVGRNSRLVPVFRDTEVEVYFESFERIATALRWPRDAWAILLQCKLVGKAQEVCSSLSAECSLDYNKLKSAILLAYELVPEAYRQRFRGLKKVQGQSFLDFARENSVLFDRWCMACKAADLVSVRELILIEEFKNCVSERTAVYLNEQKVSTLQQAATLADEFAPVHKASIVKQERRDTLAKASGASGEQGTRGEVPVPRPRSDRKCFYCFKSGHLIADCKAYRRRQPASTPHKSKGMGLIKIASPVNRPLSTETPDECFKPFIFKGAVSLSGEPKDECTVTILCDTGGSQSLILASALAFDEKTASGTDVIVRGVGMT